MRAIRTSTSILVALVAATLGFSAAAQATSWHSNYGIAYTGGGTGGTGSGAPTQGVSFVWATAGMICTGATFTTALTSATGPTSGVWSSAATLALTPSGCRFASNSFNVRCSFSYAASSYDGGLTTTYLLSAGKTSNGTLTTDCLFTLVGATTPCAETTGTSFATWSNPFSLTGDLPTPTSTSTSSNNYVLVHVGQRLNTVATAGCPIDTGTTFIGDRFGGTLYLPVTSPSPQPVIWIG
jgi:hypothetical protein